jgi:glycosyltransferase involved in cell wall biosynthesis
VHAHWLSHTSTCALGISELTGTPFSITAHRWDVYVENLFATKAQRATFVRFIARACRSVFETRVGTDTGHLVDLHMGVEAVGMRTTTHPAGRSGPLRLVTVGNLLPVKGQSYLLEALAHLRDRGIDASLDIFGDGPLRDELTARTAELRLGDRVVLRGIRPRGELAAAYARGDYDVFVMPSVDLGDGEHEGVPVSAMEAMAVGIPVVATDTGGIPELVVEGVTGLLVPQQSPAALANAVARLDADPDLGRSLGTAGEKHVREEFDAGVIAQRLLDLMQG